MTVIARFVQRSPTIMIYWIHMRSAIEQPLTLLHVVVHSSFVKSRFAKTTVHKAAMSNNMEECQRLLDCGAHVNPVDHYGWTPLHEACNHGHYEIGELLIQRGADINRKSKSGTTPLMDAVNNNHVNVIQLLLEKGANVYANDQQALLCISLTTEQEVPEDTKISR
uniref:ANK_REP_REGION domain-containing protein n=1 Tax=Trichuris muris TaxID=70415 RepID=A0A5S6QET1_TRIMR